MAKKLRWGIVGSANIARKNWAAIYHSGNGVVSAVASREKHKAQSFIDECQAELAFPDAPCAIGGYDEIIQSNEVDAVYIPLPTGMRKEWVLKAARAGKHVMCEKPCAIDASDLAEMTEACAKHSVQFMDGVMFMHSERMPQLREAIDDPERIGTIKRIASAFSFLAPPEFFEENIRSSSDLEPAGALGDLGWYTIRATLFALNYEMPRSVRGTILASVPGDGHPVPTEMSAELFFANGVSATFYNSFLTDAQQWVHVSGTNGSLRVDDFVLPFPGGEISVHGCKIEGSQDGCRFVMQNHDWACKTAEEGGYSPNAQETKLFRNFSEIVLNGSTDSFWPEISLKTQKVLDACLESALKDGELVSL